MLASELTVEVRDVDLNRLGQILPRDLFMEAHVRWCGVGEWKITLPGNHAMVPALRTPGSGILVTWRNPVTTATQVVFSGPTTMPSRERGVTSPDGTLVFTGVTDEQILADALSYPSPGISNIAAQTAANDIRTKAAEDLLREYVAYNILNGAVMPGGPFSWAPAGRLGGLRNKFVMENVSSPHRGAVLTKSPRFQNLLELCQEITVGSPTGSFPGIGFRVYQNDALLNFAQIPVRDLRDTIRFDVEAGTLTSEQVSNSGPSLTRPIVAGQGEGTGRTMVTSSLTDTAAQETAWGRVIEQFFDRRDTNDPTELTQKATDELVNARGGTAAKVVPADDITMQYLVDWNVGDWVKVVIDGAEYDSVITEAVLLFGKDRSAVGAALGDVTTFDPRDVATSKQSTIDARVSYLERSEARDAISITGDYISDANQAYESGFFNADSSTLHMPYAGSWQGTAMPGKAGGKTLVQRFTNYLSPVEWTRQRRPVQNEAWNSQPDPTIRTATTDSRGGAEWLTRWGWTVSNPTSGAPNGGAYFRVTAPSTTGTASAGWDINTNLDSTGTRSQSMRLQPCLSGEPITVSIWVRASKAVQIRVEGGTYGGDGTKLETYPAQAFTNLAANTWTQLTYTFTPTKDGFACFSVRANAQGAGMTTGDWIDGAQLSITYANGKWTPWRRSDNMLLPADTINCVSDPAGGKTALNTAAGAWSLNGIFTEEFHRYRIGYRWYGGANLNAPRLALRRDNADLRTGYLWSINDPTNGWSSSTSDSWFVMSRLQQNGHSGELILSSPMDTAFNQSAKTAQGQDNPWQPNTGTSLWAAGVSGVDAQPFDGLTLTAADSGGNPVATTAGGNGRISIQGIA